MNRFIIYRFYKILVRIIKKQFFSLINKKYPLKSWKLLKLENKLLFSLVLLLIFLKTKAWWFHEFFVDNNSSKSFFSPKHSHHVNLSVWKILGSKKVYVGLLPKNTMMWLIRISHGLEDLTRIARIKHHNFTRCFTYLARNWFIRAIKFYYIHMLLVREDRTKSSKN